MPAVSVLMSVYNGERFLAEAVESILTQTFPDFEFLIIDDGSTDSTAEILAAYARGDSRVRVVSQKNKGRTASLNEGIQLARGKYIARMDADDISLPQRLEKQLEFMTAHPETVLLGTAVEWMTQAGQIFRVENFPGGDAELREALRRENPFRHPTILMRKETVVAVRGYRQLFDESEDYDLWLRMAEVGQVASLDEPLVKYRIHPKQASASNAKRQIECLLAARAAAALRARGATDPLWNADRITPKLLISIGITQEEVRRTEFGACIYWMELLRGVGADSMLSVIERITALANSSPEERATAAAALMEAASIHYRGGRLDRAMGSLVRAAVLQPRVAGRHLGMAISRRTQLRTARR